MASTLDFDYVIIGAGTAGCLLANRLSQNPDNRIFFSKGDPNLIALETLLPDMGVLPVT